MTSTIQSDTGSAPSPETDDICWSLKTVRQKTGLSSTTLDPRYKAMNSPRESGEHGPCATTPQSLSINL
jgi:hypothetical protein